MVAAFDLNDALLTFEQAKDALLQHYSSPHKRLNPAIPNQPAQFTVCPHEQEPLHWLAKSGSRHCQLVRESQQESLTNIDFLVSNRLVCFKVADHADSAQNTSPWDQVASTKYSQTSDAVLVSA